MDVLEIKDKTFAVSISAEEIQKQVKRVAEEITSDLQGKDPIFLGILNGSFMFMADLMKYVNIPSELCFVKFSSYVGTQSTGEMKEFLGLTQDVTGRTVVIVEDIVESGFTMQYMIDYLAKRGPKEIKVATLLVKPELLKADVHIDYRAFDIPNDFIVGYGLDCDGYGRNYPDIYTLVSK